MSDLILNRRAALMLGGAVAAAPLVLTGTHAASATPEKMPLRAVHRFGLGDMKITVLDDASFIFPAPAFAANQPEGSIDALLSRYGLPTDFVNLHMQVTLVENGTAKVLLDTGMGDVTFPENPVDNGRLSASLAAVGLTADDITHVVLSHGHPDHVGGVSENGVPCFKNATYLMPPSELEFWTQKPSEEASFFNFMLAVGSAKLDPVRSMIKTYGDGDEVAPGITAIAAPGHTLGHHAFMLESQGAKLMHLMDSAVHYLVGTEEPDWALAVEMDPSVAADTRRILFNEAAEKKFLVAGYHFPFPGIGRINEDGAAWRFTPIPTV